MEGQDPLTEARIALCLPAELRAVWLLEKGNRDLLRQFAQNVEEALRQRPGAQAASEQYPSDWKRVVLMVSPTGELHSIGGDNDAPAGADSCHPGFERIKTFWVRATPAGERPAQAEPMTDEINLVLTDPDSKLSSGAERALRYVLRTLSSQSAGERPGAKAPSTAAVEALIARLRDYAEQLRQDPPEDDFAADLDKAAGFLVRLAAPSTGGAETAVTLTAQDAAFLAARLRRLFDHFGYALPAFAKDDAALIRIAGSAIGALLTMAASSAPAQAVETAPLPAQVLDEDDLDVLRSTHGFTGDVEEMAREIEGVILDKLRAALQSPAASPASNEDGSHE